jgi:hypothetical protein
LLGDHDVLVKGFMALWPLRFTFRVLRELPVKLGNMVLVWKLCRRAMVSGTRGGGVADGRARRDAQAAKAIRQNENTPLRDVADNRRLNSATGGAAAEL